MAVKGLTVCHFGLLLTWTSEEGFPLYKEEAAEYSLLFLIYIYIKKKKRKKKKRSLFAKTETAFCIRVFSVKNWLGCVKARTYIVRYSQFGLHDNRLSLLQLVMHLISSSRQYKLLKLAP